MSPYYFLIIVLLLCCQVVLTQKQTPLCGGQTGQKSKANLLASEASSTAVVDIQLDPLAKLWTSPGTYQSIDMFLTPAEITHNGQKRFKIVAIDLLINDDVHQKIQADTRGKFSREFHIYSRGMLDLA